MGQNGGLWFRGYVYGWVRVATTTTGDGGWCLGGVMLLLSGASGGDDLVYGLGSGLEAFAWAFFYFLCGCGVRFFFGSLFSFV